MLKRLIVRCDGSCKPNNPGEQIYWAFAALDARGDVVDSDSGEIDKDEVVTNNEAEYHALIEGLRWVAKNAADKVVEVQTDSQLAERQVKGIYRCEEPRLLTLRDEAKKLLRQTRAKLSWIPREQNGLADAYAQLAYQRRRAMKEFTNESR